MTNGQMSFCFSRPSNKVSIIDEGWRTAAKEKVGNMSEKSYGEKLDFLQKPLTNITYQSPVILH